MLTFCPGIGTAAADGARVRSNGRKRGLRETERGAYPGEVQHKVQ